MSTSKYIDRICAAAAAIVLAVTLLFMNGSALGLQTVHAQMGYVSGLFDTSRVHQIDIVMDDWDSFIENCESEEYSSCTVVIDGKRYKNTAIRAKGNTSLSNVRSMGSQRYSFKLEFDHYETGKTCEGLDKLCLNNLIQDNTMMKDYIVYQMMADFGVDAPLCSFTYITVNGEDWGLYLAVEGIEDSFLKRNYGSDAGDVYKPDSMSFGGGRGNGRDFNMDDFKNNTEGEDGETESEKDSAGGKESGKDSAGGKESEKDSAGEKESEKDSAGGKESGKDSAGGKESEKDSAGGKESGKDRAESGSVQSDGTVQISGNAQPDGSTQSSGNAGSDVSEIQAEGTSDAAKSGMTGESSTEGFPGGNPFGAPPDGDPFGNTSDSGYTAGDGNRDESASSAGNWPGGGNGPGGGMGKDDVKLKYIDDDPDSYSNIFDNAKTDVTSSDKKRLIAALKNLSAYTDLEDTLEMEEVLRYFVVHNFVVNGDSYTGTMIHNYYLHEKDGKLGMIPWDYNLAFGTFQGNNAASSVNSSIDSPVSGDVNDRPMVGWIFSDESYTGQYHELFSEFIGKWFSNGELAALIEETADLIRPYVEKDPTKFCSQEEFEAGVKALSEFVTLRGEAVSRQLAGDNTEVETGDLNLSDMGTMGKGGGPGGSGGPDLSSMITVTDPEGNQLSLTDLVGDLSSITSIGLSDGSTVETENADFRTLMRIDFSKVVSMTDKEGKTTDLSEYTLTMNLPFGGRMGGGPSANRQSSEEESAAGGTSEKSGSGNTADNGSGTSGNGAAQGQSIGAPGGPGSFPDMQGTEKGSEAGVSARDALILVGVSVLVLAAGLFAAVRKKGSRIC